MNRVDDQEGIDMWMNASDWLELLTAIRVDPGLALAAFAALAIVLVAWRRLQALERRTVALQHELTVFAEASRRVAARVASAQELEPRAPAPEGSRRYLVKRARMQIADGQAPSKLAAQLGLRRDELELMKLGAHSNDPSSEVATLR